MATTTLAATLNTPPSELRPATMDRILVIADDSALRKALQRLFSLEGYEVEVVTDSIAALARLRERPFSAVILDLQRPRLVGDTAEPERHDDAGSVRTHACGAVPENAAHRWPVDGRSRRIDAGGRWVRR